MPLNKRIINITFDKSCMHLPHCSLKLLVPKRSVFYPLEFRFTCCKEAELKLPSTSQTACFRWEASKVFLPWAESTLWHLREPLHYLQRALCQRRCLAKAARTAEETEALLWHVCTGSVCSRKVPTGQPNSQTQTRHLEMISCGLLNFLGFSPIRA